MPPLGLFMYCLRFRHTTYALLGCKRTRRKQRFAVQTKASYESWEAQLTRCDSWTLTARILLSKVLFFSLTKGPDYDFKLYIF